MFFKHEPLVFLSFGEEACASPLEKQSFLSLPSTRGARPCRQLVFRTSFLERVRESGWFAP